MLCGCQRPPHAQDTGGHGWTTGHPGIVLVGSSAPGAVLPADCLRRWLQKAALMTGACTGFAQDPNLVSELGATERKFTCLKPGNRPRTGLPLRGSSWGVAQFPTSDSHLLLLVWVLVSPSPGRGVLALQSLAQWVESVSTGCCARCCSLAICALSQACILCVRGPTSQWENQKSGDVDT